jgi:hypothetical protein
MAHQTELWIEIYLWSKFGQPSPVSIRTADVIISMDDVNINIVYMAHAGGDTCHFDVIMVAWQHSRLPRVTHFWIFRVDLWTNEKAPCGRPYNNVEG